MPRLEGTTHTNLTVTDLDRSTAWYTRVFGFVVVNDVAPTDYDFRFRTLVHPQSFASIVLGVPNTPVAVPRPAGPARPYPPAGGESKASAASAATATPHAVDVFDEHRVGLHHLGYHVPERADLDVWAAHLDAVGVEHSGITNSNHEAGAQIWIRDPDHIWIEVYWVNRTFFADRLRQRWREAKRAGRSDWTALAPSTVEH
jgi:glyoxylase I family protein